MTIDMDDTSITTLEQVRQVLASPRGIAFKGSVRAQRYTWIEAVLKRLNYFKLKRGEKGLINAYLRRLSGISRAQITRLIGRFLLNGVIRPSRARRNRFHIQQELMLSNLAAVISVGVIESVSSQ